MIVLDCSAALAWAFEEEWTPDSAAVLDRVQDGGALVPLHFHLEIAHVLWVADRRSRLTPADSRRYLELLFELPIEVDGATLDRLHPHTASMAKSHRLSPYDAAYLELAKRSGHPLVTKDEGMIRAAAAERTPTIRG